MVEEVEKAQVKHMVGFITEGCQLLLMQKLIEDGKIGKIYWKLLTCKVDCRLRISSYLEAKKRSSWLGPHVDLNSHMVDLAHYLVGILAVSWV